jgi:uncharacterized protein (DUF488 family)
VTPVRIATIGFTKKDAERFFRLLEEANVKRIVDVRLNNEGQLAGFAKKRDLAYFLNRILGMDYIHLPILAPTGDMLSAYKKEKGSWQDYEKRFLDLMSQRQIERHVDPQILDGGCLLCSEDKPHHCHRRLVAEYLKNHWGDVQIQHLY